MLALFLIASIVIIYSLYLALSTLAFWFTRIEEVASMIWLHSTAGSFPVTAYPPWARLLFTFVLPVAFVTNVPAQAATGRLSLGMGAGRPGLRGLCPVRRDLAVEPGHPELQQRQFLEALPRGTALAIFPSGSTRRGAKMADFPAIGPRTGHFDRQYLPGRRAWLPLMGGRYGR